MLVSDFNTDFKEYLSDEDIIGANDAIMKKLGEILVNRKKEFIDLLNESGIEADISMPNNQLIELFIDNCDNKFLLLGASLVVNLENKINCKSCNWSWNLNDGGNDPLTCHKCGNDNSKSSFDNSENTLDDDVKIAYVVMNENFNDNDSDEYSNALGAIAAGLIGRGVKKFIKNKRQSRDSSSDLRLRAELKMQNAAIAQQKILIEKQKQEIAESKKIRNIVLISSGSLLLIGLVALVIYKNK